MRTKEGRPGPGRGQRHPVMPTGASRVLLAVARHPELWGVAVGMAVRLAPRGWWRRWPYLPVPDPGYWHFRMVTAYGGTGDSAPEADDVVAYLRWCRHVWRRDGRGLG